MIISLRNRTNKGFIKQSIFVDLLENKRLVLLTVVFTIGMVIGCEAVRDNSSSLLVKLLTLFNNYRELKTHQSILTNFFNSFIISFAYIIFVYCVGLCAVGMPVVYFVPMLRGLGYGIVSGYLYGAYALKGLGYSMLLIFPGAIVSVITLLAACNESVIMSRDMLKMISGNSTENESSYKVYNVRYIIFCVLTAFGAAVDTLFNMLFSGYFIFN